MNIQFGGTTGRVSLAGSSDAAFPKNTADVIVGPYNSKNMPAIMIFPDANCNVIPRRFYFNPEDGDSSFYNMEDMLRQDLVPSWAGYSRAVMVPPGYDLTLYSKEAWRGYHEVYHG